MWERSASCSFIFIIQGRKQMKQGLKMEGECPSLYFDIFSYYTLFVVGNGGFKCDLWHFPRLPELANMDMNWWNFPEGSTCSELISMISFRTSMCVTLVCPETSETGYRVYMGIRCTPQNVPGHQHCNFSNGKHDDKPIGFGGCSIFGDIPRLINIDMTNPAFNRSFPRDTMDFPYLKFHIYRYLSISI